MEISTEIKMHNGSGVYRIECLQGERVLDTRPLWEEVFSEDSKAFTDYYFARKASSNTVFICRHLPTGQIVSMVHLTPYEMTLQKIKVPTFYIVGVATKEAHRKKGLMSTLLNQSFAYASRFLCPFVFLMPADPAIYEPFGFSYVYKRPQYRVPESARHKEVYINQIPAAGIQIQYLEKEASPQTLSALSDFAQKTLSAQFDYYLTRTPSYYRTLLLELYVQNGRIYTFSLHGRLEGYFLYTEEENRPFIQELLFSDKLRSYINFPDYVNSSGNVLSAASLDSSPEYTDSLSNFMSTIFPTPLPELKPIIMAKNLLPDSESFPISESCPAPGFTRVPESRPESGFLSASESLPAPEPSPSMDDSCKSPSAIPDYVNFLSTHKGCINEIV